MFFFNPVKHKMLFLTSLIKTQIMLIMHISPIFTQTLKPAWVHDDIKSHYWDIPPSYKIAPL